MRVKSNYRVNVDRQQTPTTVDGVGEYKRVASNIPIFFRVRSEVEEGSEQASERVDAEFRTTYKGLRHGDRLIIERDPEQRFFLIDSIEDLLNSSMRVIGSRGVAVMDRSRA